MTHSFSMRSTAKAALVLISASALVHTVSTQAADKAASKKAGAYVSGDFHNHTTCSDGSLSVQKLVDKSTGNKTGAYNLDWFIQTDHGGASPRNCTLAEDPFEPNTPSLALTTTSNSGSTPSSSVSYNAPTTNPYGGGGQYTSGKGPNQTWVATLSNGASGIKGTVANSSQGGITAQGMWRWQEIKEYQYQVLEKESRNRKKPIWIGNELVAPGHEHVQVTILDGQAPWPSTSTSGNANLVAQHEFCFDNKGMHVLCEGYATALSVRLALKSLKKRYTLHVCFSAGNMKKMADLLKPDSGLIVADNDLSGTGERVAKEIGWNYWISDVQGEDANDAHQRMGLFRFSQSLLDKL